MWKCNKTLASFTSGRCYKGNINEIGILELYNDYGRLESLIICKPYFDKILYFHYYYHLKSIFLCGNV